MNEKKSFYVIGMSCAGCAANIQQALSERKGVIEARVNFAASDVIVENDRSVIAIPPCFCDRDVFYAYALWQLDHAGIYLTGPTGIRKGFFH